ncbi:MAG: 3-deoxy-D-manno-octulosonic acid transferase [Candidatus Omnitrophica bacterium]|nr:3-deoxy-D-manno-octulosonic acid transferase [Candidatus Omnitrophota bacterium]
MKAILILYDFILVLLIPFYLVSLILKGKFSFQVFKRFLIGDKAVWQVIKAKETIWLHAVSLGEVLTCKNLINKLSRKYPDKAILITTVTATGMASAKSLSKDNIVSLYMPFDLGFLISHFIKTIKPNMLILLETELWPNLLYYSQKKEVPVLVLNARLSDRSFGKYRLFSWFVKRLVKPVKMFCAQSDLDAGRFAQIGIEKERIKITGNMKFDTIDALDKVQSEEMLNLKDRISLASQDFLIVAGSTHDKEEEYILDIFKKLKGQFKNLRLLIAPRHLERIDSIEKMIARKGLKPYRCSSFNSPSSDGVLILDAVGKLLLIYGLADLVFVGGSLVPVGGHNILEPAFFGKPIIVGPYTHNFREITEAFLSAGALAQAEDVKDMESKIAELISNRDRLIELGRAAKSVLSSRQGATPANLAIIEKTLNRDL